MSTYQQRGMTIEALQWLGALDQATLPYWLRSLALHHENQGPLTLPQGLSGRSGTTQAIPGDWIVRLPGCIEILPDVTFVALYAPAGLAASVPDVTHSANHGSSVAAPGDALQGGETEFESVQLGMTSLMGLSEVEADVPARPVRPPPFGRPEGSPPGRR
jgi:hypothetical protein